MNEKKIGFLEGLFRVVYDPSIIKDSINLGPWRLFFHLKVLIIILTLAFGHFIHHQILLPRVTEYFQALPVEHTVTIKDNQAEFHEIVKFPYVYKFGEEGKGQFHFILRDDDRLEQYAGEHETFLAFGKNIMAFQSLGNEYQSLGYDELNSAPIHYFFGDPIQFSPEGYGKLIASVLSMVLLIFIPPFIPFPLAIFCVFLFLISSFFVSSIIAALIAKRGYSLKQIWKAVAFSYAVTVYVQAMGLFFTTGSLLMILFVLAHVLQIVYLKYGLMPRNTIEG